MRNLGKSVLFGLLVLALAVGALLWWLPALLPAVAGQFGVELESVVRVKDGRWQLTGLRYAQSGVRISADTAEIPSPQRYLLERWRGAFTAASEVKVQSLSIVLDGNEVAASEPSDKTKFYLADFSRDLRAQLQAASSWIPRLRVDYLSLSLPEKTNIQFTELELDATSFLGRLAYESAFAPFQIRGGLSDAAPWELHVAAADFELRAQLGFDSSGVELEAQLEADAGTAQAQAHFVPGQVLPDRADVFSDQLDLNLSDLGFARPEIEQISLQKFQGKWDGQNYQGTVQWFGEYAPEAQAAWPIEGEVEFVGDLNRLFVQTLQASLAWCELSLDAPLEIDLQTGRVAQRAELNLEMDLSRQPFVPDVAGEVEARVSLLPDFEAGLNLSYELEGRNVEYADIRVPKFDVAGTIRDRLLSGELNSMELELPQQSPLDLSGSYSWGLGGGFSLDAKLRSEQGEIIGNCNGRYANGALRLNVPSLLVSSTELGSQIHVEFEVERLEFRPYLLGSASFRLRAGQDDTWPLGLEARVTLDRDGLGLDQLWGRFSTAPILTGQMRLPVKFKMPADGQAWYELGDEAALDGELKGQSTLELKQWLFDAFGIELEQAAVDVHLAGTLAEPEGKFNLTVESVDYDGAGGVPALRDIQLTGSVGPEQIRVDQLGLVVNQSRVSGSGYVSLAVLRAFSGSESRELDAWLKLGAGTLKLEAWELSNWTPYLPAILRQTGQLDGVLTLQPDGDLEGQLAFKELGFRPTEDFHSLESIQGQLSVSGRTLSVDSMSAQLGGSLLAIEGNLNFSQLETPTWDFRLSGENLPLVRSSKMILRSDVDLRAFYSGGAKAPSLQGQLNLRSSTLLVDFDPLASRVHVGTSQRPPYFSIESAALADWTFDIKLQGDSFMRVRNPYFSVSLSADFTLTESFAEPMLLGSLRVASGELRFPGARMELDQGEAYIEPSQPHTVQLDINGSAQTASYVVGMEVLGSLDAPLVQFQSSPVLSNAQIIRLLATGGFTGGAGTVGLYLGKGLFGASGLEDSFMDRLKVDVGNEKTRSGHNTVDARYDLSENWYLEGGYDQYDAYNLDLIWSIFRR